jgi:hypothetical protein
MRLYTESFYTDSYGNPWRYVMLEGGRTVGLIGLPVGSRQYLPYELRLNGAEAQTFDSLPDLLEALRDRFGASLSEEGFP